jgi:hypothetical protein
VPLAASEPSGPEQAGARREAAAKIAANRTAIVGDLLKNTGIVRSRTNQYGNTLRARLSTPVPTASCVSCQPPEHLTPLSWPCLQRIA